MDLTQDQKRQLRTLHFEKGISAEVIAERFQISSPDVVALLNEPDSLNDFELYHFGDLTRKLHAKALDIIDSITIQNLEDAPISSRSTLLRTSLDVMQKSHDLHMIHKDKSEDFKLARLLAMGREEAREALVERFKGLAHILFGGMSEEELVKLMRSMNGELPDAPTTDTPNLTLVAAEGGDDVGSSGAKPTRSPGPAQGIGAFRGIKESEPS